MAIVGIDSLAFGVEDLEVCTKFFVDFGLPLRSSDATSAAFELDNGSAVVLRRREDPALPRSALTGPGVREVVWGVDTRRNIDRLIADLSVDRELRVDGDGTAHFLTDCGLPFALRVSERRSIVSAPDPLNAPGTANRLNRPRKWRARARPKLINHVVFNVVDVEKSFAFVRDRLGFRATDYQAGFGIYTRCDGAPQHHTLFLANAHLPFPGFNGRPEFNHANFGVEDIDEIMVGANHMERQGWSKSVLGLGRHRVDSALFYYIPCPAGGDAEYGADGDFVDDTWVPRRWTNPLFGYLTFAHNMPAWFMKPPSWDVEFHGDFCPRGTGAKEL